MLLHLQIDMFVLTKFYYDKVICYQTFAMLIRMHISIKWAPEKWAKGYRWPSFPLLVCNI